MPFTPATGRRLLVAPGAGAQDVRTGLASGLIELARLREASSVHVTFAPEDEWKLLCAHGYLPRTDQQFHWDNGGYTTFDDFLGALAARKRKAIRRERQGAIEPGLVDLFRRQSLALGGVLGALFAVPVAALANVFLGAIYRAGRGQEALTTSEDGVVKPVALPRLGEEIGEVKDEGPLEGDVPHTAGEA